MFYFFFGPRSGFGDWRDNPVRAAIAAHINGAVATAQRRLILGEADEDFLSGIFGGLLSTDPETVRDTSGRPWTWQMEVSKLGSRGKRRGGEPATGADLVIQLVLQAGDKAYSKGLLVQSKVRGRDEGDLLDQCRRLDTWRGAALIAHVGPRTIRAADPGDVVRRGLGVAKEEDFAKALEKFVNCQKGAHGIYYEPGRRKLYWPVAGGGSASTEFAGAATATATFGIGTSISLREYAPLGSVVEVDAGDLHGGAHRLDIRHVAHENPDDE